MTSCAKTEGELLFEQYLREMAYEYEFEKTFPGRSKHPDYTVKRDGTFLFDVKDFESRHVGARFGYFDPYPPIREKVEQARDKFREFKDYPCSLVLRNCGNPAVMIEDPNIVLGAMYGDSGFTFPVDIRTGAAAGPLNRAFLGRGKMVRPNWTKAQNTTISALLTLRYIGVGFKTLCAFMRKFPDKSYDELVAIVREREPAFDPQEKQLGMIVWENAHARIALSRKLFTGPYDERWGVEGNEQGIVFRGSKLLVLEGLDESRPH